ncbi:MmpS family transport accessory protein [Streptomyces sp. 21So2-11]|uniref:MmpS family transport accessory protein n=1 Tax=Streptomyces sp. 21So2-11 TaxID=3144408 RepID=UPI00321AFBC6
MSDTAPPPPEPPGGTPGGPQWGPRPPAGGAGGYPPPGYPPPGYGYPPPPKKRRVWPWIVLGIAILLIGGCAAVMAVFINAVDDESERVVKVKYAVTGNAKDVSITYSTWRDGNLSSSSVSNARLPWRKEVDTTGFLKGGHLTVVTGADGGTVTCTVTVDDKEPTTATASGPLAIAGCDDF